MKTKLWRMLLAALAGGLGMWIIAGLWHNLILPAFSESAEAHHEGLVLMLIAYFVLAILMVYIYSLCYKGGKPVLEGLKIGVVIFSIQAGTIAADSVFRCLLRMSLYEKK